MSADFKWTDDYKWDLQVRAEEIAQERFDRDFYALPEAERDSVYAEAMDDWRDAKCAKADQMRDESNLS